MQILKLFDILLWLIPIGCAFGAVYWYVTGKEKNIFGLFRINMNTIKKRLSYLAAAVVVFFLICVFVNVENQRQNVGVVVGLNYIEASGGLNPNKTKFTASELSCEGVMENIIKKSGMEVDPDVLQGGFSVSPVRVAKYVELEQPYVATEYTVKFSSKGMPSGVNANKVMEYYSDSLKEYFAEKYSRKTNVLDIDFSSLETADYLDIDEILSTKASEIINYMNAMSKTAGTFISESTGEGFRSLYKKISDYNNTALENYRSFILKNGISKDKSQYIVKKTYQNRIYENSYLKQMGIYNTYITIINMYERDMASIVLVPTRDTKGEFYMSRTKIGVDDFSKNAEDAASAASGYQKSISDNEYKINQLNANAEDESKKNQADAMIETLKSELSEFARLAKETVTEYDEKTSGGYVVVTDEESGGLILESAVKAAEKAILLLITLGALTVVAPKKKSAENNNDGREIAA